MLTQHHSSFLVILWGDYSFTMLLINNIKARGWNAVPLIVLASGARATTHIPSTAKLETKLKLPTSQIRITFRQINIIATQYVHSILIHKRRIENRQPVIDLQNHI